MAFYLSVFGRVLTLSTFDLKKKKHLRQKYHMNTFINAIDLFKTMLPILCLKF